MADDSVEAVDLDGGSGGSEDGDGAGELDRWQRRCEVLALVLVLASAGAMFQGLFSGLALARGQGGGGDLAWSVLLPNVASGGSFFVGLLLALALGLIVLAPGEKVGRLGSGVLNAVSVLGVVATTLAVLGLEETFRQPNDYGGFEGPDGTARLFARLGGVSLWVPSAVLAGTVAYFAWRLLLELYPKPPRVASDRAPVDLDEDERFEGVDPA